MRVIEEHVMENLVFLFPGQGTQYVGMIKDIVREYPETVNTFRQAEDILGWDLLTLVLDGPEECLNLTEYTQPCLLTVEVSVLRLLESMGIHAQVLLGFSLGEWSALVASGVLSFADALKLVSVRAYAMQQAVPLGQGGMVVILGRSAKEVQELCSRAAGYVEPSNYNCPGQISVAGDTEGIESILKMAKEKKIAAQRIPVSIPSHCALMKSAAEQLKEEMRGIAFRPARIPIVMNCCAKIVSDAMEIRKNVILQLTNPVRMEESITTLLEHGFYTFIEIGPGLTLSKFAQKCGKSMGITVKTLSTRNIRSLDETLKACLE